MDTKPWWQSKTIWGGAIQALVVGLSLFHVNIADQAEPLTNGLYALGGLIGVIMVIVGRVKARTNITLTKEDNAPRVGGGPLMMLVVAFLIPALFFAGCAEGPVRPASPVAVVGTDFQRAASQALQAYADYKAGNVSLTWALQEMFSAYPLSAKSGADVKALVKAWTGNTGDSQALADKLSPDLRRVHRASGSENGRARADHDVRRGEQRTVAGLTNRMKNRNLATDRHGILTDPRRPFFLSVFHPCSSVAPLAWRSPRHHPLNPSHPRLSFSRSSAPRKPTSITSLPRKRSSRSARTGARTSAGKSPRRNFA